MPVVVGTVKCGAYITMSVDDTLLSADLSLVVYQGTNRWRCLSRNLRTTTTKISYRSTDAFGRIVLGRTNLNMLHSVVNW